MRTRNRTERAILWAFIVLWAGCAYPRSGFVCDDGDEAGDRLCRDGVWISTDSTDDAGVNNINNMTDTGQNNCVPETDTDFCTRLGKDCDGVQAEDNCGLSRNIYCGDCDGGLTCEGGGVPNVCGSPDDPIQCMAAQATCGTIRDATDTRDITCGVCGTAMCVDNNCACDTGYRVLNMIDCEDIDECSDDTNDCDPITEVCANLPGTFQCDCATGYELLNGNCVARGLVIKTDRVSIVVDDQVGTADISGMFADTTNVVPFLSVSLDNSGSDIETSMFDVAIDATTVTVTRTDNAGTATVDVELVQFNPARVTIQTGVLALNDGDADDIVSINNVDTTRTFVVFYANSDSAIDERKNGFLSATLATDEVEFQRDSSDEDMEGHFWVVESDVNGFTVDHIDGGTIADFTAQFAAPNTDPNTSFLLYSYENDVNGEASRGHVGCAIGTNVVDCARLSESNEIRNLRLQVVKTANRFSVTHGQHDMDLVAVQNTAIVADEFLSTLLVGHLGAAGAVPSNRNDGNLWRGYVRGTYDGNQVTTVRGSADGQSIANWSLIEW